jgi:hypothetical protein
MHVKRNSVPPVDQPPETISIHEISLDVAEKLMAVIGRMESRAGDEVSYIYVGIQAALGKRRYEPSKYAMNVNSTIKFSIQED